MLWSTLEKRLASKPIYSRTTLMERPEEGWVNIDQELCIKLVESIPERTQKCLKAKGEHCLSIEWYLCRFFCIKLLVLKSALKFGSPLYMKL